MSKLRAYEQLQAIQLLRGIIRKWWGLELSFADENGYVLDHAEGKIAPPNNDVCRASLAAKEGFHRCNESTKAVRAQLQKSGPRVGQRCVVHECHLGFDIIACPITFDGESAGFMFVGGFVQKMMAAAEEEVLFGKLREIIPPRGLGIEGERALRTIKTHNSIEVARICDLLELGAAEIETYHARVRNVIVVEEPYRFENIVGKSRAMRGVFGLLEKIIDSDSTVLINGESGTGKELIARAIHFNGPRAKKTFVVQNCSAFNDNLLESALFGHTKGSFTGAIKDNKGLFEQADGGTFFLDEIGDMSPSLQVKLLRVLQEGTFTPVGSNEQKQVDVRVLAATHKDLQKMVARGEFREDLYYRINVIKVDVPPLRDRMDDMQLLCDHFLRKHFRARGGRTLPPPLSAEAMAALQAYPWPGNIRELENEIERLLVLGGQLDSLPADLLSARVQESSASRPTTPHFDDYESAGSLRGATEQLERDLILQGLIRTHYNKSQLAKDLGISRSNLIMKVERYGLERTTHGEQKK